MASRRTCSVDGCEKVHYARGWCGMHYMRWREHGDPLGGSTFEGEPLRWIKEVAIQHEGCGCLIWPFSKCNKGYGTVKHQGRTAKVHRLVCAIANGQPPGEKHHAAHSCGNGHLGCVNPRHLRWATAKENSRDTFIHGKRRRCGAKLSDCNVREIRRLSSVLPTQKIAKKFKVSCGTVRDVASRTTWAWVEG
jgi:hypothetical protein